MQQIISRDEYLAAREAWKNSYVTLSANIRALKIATRLACKAGYSAQARVNEAKQAVASTLQSMRAKESNYAAYMMQDLEKLKELARYSVKVVQALEMMDFLDEFDDGLVDIVDGHPMAIDNDPAV